MLSPSIYYVFVTVDILCIDGTDDEKLNSAWDLAQEEPAHVLKDLRSQRWYQSSSISSKQHLLF